jgi:NADH dehydrogenase FAD-containing subunit
MPDNAPNSLDLISALLSALIIILPIGAKLIVNCLEVRLSELKVKVDSNTAITKRNEDGLKSVSTQLAATRSQLTDASAASATYRAGHPAPTPAEELNR